MARDMEFRESRGRSCTLRNLGDWEPQASFGEKTLAQFIASKAIASSVLPAEKESKEEKGVKTEVRNHLGVRRGLNPILSRARVGTERTLCAADLDDMYNL